jgi:hypothetical protein
MSSQSKALFNLFVDNVLKELNEKEIQFVILKEKSFLNNCFVNGLSEEDTVIEIWKTMENKA